MDKIAPRIPTNKQNPGGCADGGWGHFVPCECKKKKTQLGPEAVAAITEHVSGKPAEFDAEEAAILGETTVLQMEAKVVRCGLKESPHLRNLEIRIGGDPLPSILYALGPMAAQDLAFRINFFNIYEAAK